jgi:protein translocase SecG subunit
MFFTILQVIISLLLIGAILLQVQGTGLTSAFGGSGEFYRSKRSIERFVFQATIVLTVLFGIASFILLFPHK